jgi:hypothetical protein
MPLGKQILAQDAGPRLHFLGELAHGREAATLHPLEGYAPRSAGNGHAVDGLAGDGILEDVRRLARGKLPDAKAGNLGVEHQNVAHALGHHQPVGISLEEFRQCSHSPLRNVGVTRIRATPCPRLELIHSKYMARERLEINGFYAFALRSANVCNNASRGGLRFPRQSAQAAGNSVDNIDRPGAPRRRATAGKPALLAAARWTAASPS